MISTNTEETSGDRILDSRSGCPVIVLDAVNTGVASKFVCAARGRDRLTASVAIAVAVVLFIITLVLQKVDTHTR
jgi:hypothetical protein